MSVFNRHEEIWRQLAGELQGQFVDGGFWKEDKVEARWDSWTITLDKYVVHGGRSHRAYTRLRAPYVNPDGFRFRIYRKSIFTGIGKALGLVRDIEIGEEAFDRDFVIQGNSEEKVRAMLGRPRLRALIEAQPDICFEGKDDELYFLASGVIKDLEQLRGLYNLFAEVLDYLHSSPAS